ncbi:hypothetical protein BC937DRAFT_87620 [Endogone sp. FLAS-F59071]|nr:hypothetical protein BC937DRAFT_87620 [Endogone sp. FLAS-F59071]|eukprot:RUS19353.1 hypothetical protein BC937DRAFT_87620 [Endogone sp. FLAS-F59071]
MLGDTEYSTIPFMVQWVCKFVGKFISRFSKHHTLETNMSEGTFIVRYLGCLIDDLFTDLNDFELEWGEKALIASSINRNTVDPNVEDDERGLRQRIGKKTDCIGYRLTARREDGQELLLMEVVGPPCRKNEQKYKQDRAALLKGIEAYSRPADCHNERRPSSESTSIWHSRFKITLYRCQLLHHRVYTTTAIGDFMLPSSFEEIKRLAKILKLFIRMRLEIQDVLKELKEAAWDSDDEGEKIIDLRETLSTPKKKSN